MTSNKPDRSSINIGTTLSKGSLPEFEVGSVWFIGAGPGDPALLTLLALHGLQQADIILYDALVSQGVLDMAHPSAQKIYVGKRAGQTSNLQDHINQMLIDEAKKGRRVLRLKGGDPLVFARGGEEAMALFSHAIPFRFVPGITSGVAALSYAGIPSTHRDFNQSITFITAHDRAGGLNHSLDWSGHAKTAELLIVYMGSRLLKEITERLCTGGRDPDEPLAAISRATWPDQKVVVSTLGKASENSEIKALSLPILIVIGQNVSLRSELDYLARLESVKTFQEQGA